MLSILELQELSRLGVTDRLKAVANKFGYGPLTNHAMKEIEDFIPKAPKNAIHAEKEIEPTQEEVEPVAITNKKPMPSPKPKEIIPAQVKKALKAVPKPPLKKSMKKVTPAKPTKPPPKKGK